MKKILTLLAASVASLGLNAQITISQSDFASWTPGIDTFRDLDTPMTFASGANASWDLAVAKYKAASYMAGYSTFSNAGLPNAALSYNASYGFSSLTFTAAIAGRIAASGIEELGESVSTQSIDISALTRKAGDSLIFPAQIIAYTAPRVRLQLPATFGKAWTSTYNANMNVTLKYGGNYYNFNRTRYATQSDNISGWGRVRIKRLDGSNSGWMDVLAVESRLTTKDSFFSTIPQATLNMIIGPFGLIQGMGDSTHTLQLYRKGEVSPLVVVGFKNTKTDTMRYGSVHQSRIPVSVGVNEIPAAAGVKLYPNPATAAGGFNIELTETAAGVWNYSLLDASGKVVSSSAIAPNGTKAHIDAAQAAPGLYFLNVQNNGQQVATKPILIK